MKSFASLAQFAVQAHVISENLEHVQQEVIRQAAEIVEDRAKSELGGYGLGVVPLKASTIARKGRGDSPLLETGELRNSIEHTIGDKVAWVGSNNDKAVWHELGTSKMPPRPFLSLAAIASEPAIHKMARRQISAALTGDHDLRHILHAATHALKEVKDFAADLVADPDEKRRR